VTSLPSHNLQKRRYVADGETTGLDADNTEVPECFSYQWFTYLDGISKPRKTKEQYIISFILTDSRKP
jgi:hypothetical protein